MTDEQQIKREFVQRLSFAFQVDDRVRVRKMEYRVYPERVEITFRNGYTVSVNVEGDSCKAICADVLKHV